MDKKPQLKFADFFIFIVFVAVILVFAFMILSHTKNAKPQVIIENGNDTWIYSLDKNGRYKINGKMGESIIVIKDKSVFFEESPCKNKLCIYAKPIYNEGEWIACLPNGVMVHIQSKNVSKTEVDAISK